LRVVWEDGRKGKKAYLGRSLEAGECHLEKLAVSLAEVGGLVCDAGLGGRVNWRRHFARFEEVRVESFVCLGAKRRRLESGRPKDELRGRSCVGEFGWKLRVLVAVWSWELGRVCGS
jgi:hypothetical protein